MNYLAWNDALAGLFFKRECEGKRVFLFVTQETIRTIALENGVEPQSFIQAVKEGPIWATQIHICRKAFATYAKWRERENLIYPPYIAYLALFVLGAGLDGDFSTNSYYPRLRTLLGEHPDIGQPNGFSSMLRLWDDLETWTTSDNQCRLGIFRTDFIGNQIHIGVPIAQTFLSEDDIKKLPSFFSRFGFDPLAPPSKEEILQKIRSTCEEYLRVKTCRLLRQNTSSSAPFIDAFLDVIVDELEQWDGSIEEQAGDENNLSHAGTIRLHLRIDNTKRQIHCQILCRTISEFPEDGLTIRFSSSTPISSRPDIDASFRCEEDGNGWSTPVSKQNGEVLNGTVMDWTKNYIASDSLRGFKFAFHGNEIRIFTQGHLEGLPGWIEVRNIQPESKTCLAVHNSVNEEIKSWGSSSCEGWVEIPISGGAPTGWSFYEFKRARTDQVVRSRFPELSLPAKTNFKLVGGIKAERGATYFDFGLPNVLILGDTTDVVPMIESRPIPKTPAGEYSIQHALGSQDRQLKASYIVTLTRNGIELAKKRFNVFTKTDDWPQDKENVKVDNLGNEIPEANLIKPYFCGAKVYRDGAQTYKRSFLIPIGAKGTTYLVGPSLGQVCAFADRDEITEWSPVWMIVSRKTSEAFFCGNDVYQCNPSLETTASKKEIKLWKQLLYVERKSTKLKGNAAEIRKLWDSYKRVAQYASS